MGFEKRVGIATPIICGPMYPCSNPELVAAVSNAGGIGVIQPVSLTYVYGYGLREGIRYIKSLSDKPLGFNVLIDAGSKRYEKKMKAWVDIALEEGIRFFITSLGNPFWVVEKAHAKKALVYHDVTEIKWAEVALKAGVDGLIAVNNRAGGHTGSHSAKELFTMLKTFDLPLICAGGIGDKKAYDEMLDLGYEGVQMGTRFIATTECDVSLAYKEAIIRAKEEDIVLTKKLTGVDVSIISPRVESSFSQPFNSFFSWLLSQRFLKKMVRLLLVLRAIPYLKKTRHASKEGVWQAGKSVEAIKSITSVADIFKEFRAKD